MKIALVHDWLDSYRGGEKVVEALLEVFPSAEVHTLFYNPEKLPDTLTKRPIQVVCKSQWIGKFRKHLFPLLGVMIESINLNGYDLVISSSSGFAKGVIPHPGTLHICYMHTPMRYVWDQQHEYERGWLSNNPFRALFRMICSYMRIWDISSTARVDYLIANSQFVAQRMQRYYRRKADRVIFPPVAVEELQQYRRTQDYPTRDYWLVAGALVPYKRVDLAIRACEALGQKLIVAGQGPSLVELQSIAGKNIEFRTNVDNDEWRKLLMNAKGLLFPGIEDFGMTPVEAMALGTPVLAFKRGGALDYIKPGINGDFFNEQTVASLVQRMRMFESQSWSQEHISHSVSVFDTRQFKHIFAEFVKEHLGSVT